MVTKQSSSDETGAIISLCWDACLEYGLARAELFSSCDESEVLYYLDMPSVPDDIVGVALRNATTEYVATSPEGVLRVLALKRRGGMEGLSDAGEGRVGFRGFASLLASLHFVANVVQVLKERYAAMLRGDRLLAECIAEELEARSALLAEEEKDREEILSATRRWCYAQQFRDQIQKSVERAQVRSAVEKDVEMDCLRISAMRRATLEKEEERRRESEETVHYLSRLDTVETVMDTLHEQIAVAQAYEAASLALQRDEQMHLFNPMSLLCSERSLMNDRMDQLEWQLGVLGRFAVGLSLAQGGIRGHNAVLRSTKASGFSDDLTWLLENIKDSSLSEDENSILETSSKSSQLQLCVRDASYYKLPSNENGSGIQKIPSMSERHEIEASLQTAFSLLTKLGCAGLPYPQKYASTLDKIILYPAFEVFVTECEMKVIGSKQLAFTNSATSQLDSNITEYLNPLVRPEDSWTLQYGLGYDDFIGFLVDQAAVENVQCAYMLKPGILLKYIVKDIIEPKWIKRHSQESVSGISLTTEALGSTVSPPLPSAMALSLAEGSRDLCLLLNTALTWLSLASISVEEYALAYQRQVIQYDFTIRPSTEQGDYITTTKALLPILVSHSESENTLGIRCERNALESLRQRNAVTEFARISATIGMDGSLDAVTAWMSLAIDKVSREDLLLRIADTIDRILRESITGIHFHEKTNITHSTPISWILTLSLCASLAFSVKNGIIPRLDKFFRSIVSIE